MLHLIKGDRTTLLENICELEDNDSNYSLLILNHVFNFNHCCLISNNKEPLSTITIQIH